MTRIDPSRGADAALTPDQARLRKAAHDLEGVFVNELFKAMRATVSHDGILSQDPGEDMFTSMMDSRLAETYGARSQGGLGEALYRQLSRRLVDGEPGANPAKGVR